MSKYTKWTDYFNFSETFHRVAAVDRGFACRFLVGWALVAGIVLVLLPAATTATNVYFSHGTGIKNRALAGAGVAFPQDAMAAATNPAGLAFVGRRLDVGAVIFRPERGYSAGGSRVNGRGGAFTIGAGTEDSDDQLFLIPGFGLNYPLGERDSVGFSIYGNGGMNTSYDGGGAMFDTDGPGAAPVSRIAGTFGDGLGGGSGVASVELMQVFFNLSYVRRFSDDLAVGIAPILAVQSFRNNGLDAFAGFTKTFAASNGGVAVEDLTNNGQDYSYGGGVQLGILLRDVLGEAGAGGSVDFGVSYRSRIYMSRFDDYADLFAEDGDFDIPATLWAGVAVELSERLTLVADYQRIWYGDVDAVSNDVRNVFDCPAAGRGGGDVESCLGGDDGPGFGWGDIDVFKAGLQWEMSPDVSVRLGYSHADQAVDDSQVLFNILAPAVVEDHVTLGATFKLEELGEISVEAMHAPHNSVKGRNTFDPTQEIRLRMKQYEVGIGWSREF